MKTLSRPEKWILIGIPILFFIGSIMHFLYNIFGENPFVGLIAPVNESIWEHTKMVLLPIILWWSIFFFAREKHYAIDKNKWFTGALASLLTAIITIPLIYYFYTEAFGVELLWADILILLLSVTLGQLLGLHIYRNGTGINANFVISVFIVLILIFMLFTFFPPHIPIFRDGPTGGYGVGV